ncbi:PLL family lectin [Flavitalea flava]
MSSQYVKNEGLFPATVPAGKGRDFTRVVKNLKYLQKNAPHLFPYKESSTTFETTIPASILSKIHRVSYNDPSLNDHPALAAYLRENRIPGLQFASRGALFTGNIHFVQVTFRTPSGNFVIPDADMNMIVNYAQHAIVPIMQYAAQYGSNSSTISPAIISYSVNLSGTTYDDGDLQNWVNDIVSINQFPPETCIVIVSPQGVSAPNVGGNSGYHSKADTPYAVFGVYANRLTLQDFADVYAMVVSHEIAEMIVDPEADISNPEVCDPCDINCGILHRAYFDDSNQYLGTNQLTPPGGFSFSYYICPLVMQNSANLCPAPDNACNYSPYHNIWKQFQLAPINFAAQNGCIASVSRIPNSMEIFWIGGDGSVWDAFWYEGMSQWERFQIAPPGMASQSGGIAAVSRIPNSLEIFWIGADGSVWDAFWYEGMTQWDSFQIAPPGMASQGGGITAVSRIPNSMEIFWIGGDGSVWDAFWYEGMTEWDRFQLAAPGMASQSGGITAVSRIPNSMEVFWIGGDGSVWDAFWYEGMTQWDSFQLAPPDWAAQNGSITAISRIPNSMEIFWIGGDGSVWDAFWYEGMTQWDRFQLAPPAMASQNGDITVISRIPNSMEIFWIGGDGSIWDAYWYEGMTQWNYFQLAPPDLASQSGSITAVSRIPNSMETFWIGGDGSIWDAYWYA